MVLHDPNKLYFYFSFNDRGKLYQIEGHMDRATCDQVIALMRTQPHLTLGWRDDPEHSRHDVA